MQFKNLQIILTFVIYVSLVISSPIKKEKEDISFIQDIKATEKMRFFPDNFKVFKFEGDDGVDAFLETGGFATDAEIFNFILNRKGYNSTNIMFDNKGMACSAFQTPNELGNGFYFGRNFDFFDGTRLIVVDHPENGYSSISTVNTDFIHWIKEDISIDEYLEIAETNPELLKQNIEELPDDILKIVSLYIPVDGVNEKGLSISVNMVPGYAFNQNNPGKRNLTTGSFIRVLLNKAANVDEAIEIVNSSNMHATIDLNVHFLISDATGKCVTVEYVNGKTFVIDTKIITNFYISDEIKEFSFGTEYDDERYYDIQKAMTEHSNMTVENVRDTLKIANQEEFTLWSVIYDQLNLEAIYYFNNNYNKGYHIKLFEDDNSDDETILVVDGELTSQEDSDDDKTLIEEDSTDKN